METYFGCEFNTDRGSLSVFNTQGANDRISIVLQTTHLQYRINAEGKINLRIDIRVEKQLTMPPFQKQEPKVVGVTLRRIVRLLER
jgi:hypothetical protein